MIVSQEKGFVFMHNPKVAGSSVRSLLEPFRDTETNLFGPDEESGSRSRGYDLAHIGLDEFATFFPEIWQRAKDLPFFALYRDPEKRFFSSVNEYSRVYGDVDVRFAPLTARVDFLKRTVDRLMSLGSAEAVLSELELTHFRPQWIYLEGEIVQPTVKAFHIRNFANFAKQLSTVCGDTLDFPRENSSEHFAVGGVLGRVLGRNAVKKTLRRIPGSMAAMQVLRASRRADTSSEALSPAQRYGLSAVEGQELTSFISGFYARDVKTIAALQAADDRAVEAADG